MSEAAPALSVLFVAHGAWDWTDRALAAVAEHTRVPHEVVLVDNASPDGTAERVRLGHPGVVLVENADNAGFGPGNNQAAALARAPVLVLLNTDAIVGPGWSEPLLAALARPGVGAAVAQLVHLDGRLQEAGALLGADGSVLAYGDGRDPEDLAYRFPRVVDFGAAACMAVRAELFAQLGGFDDRYAPAYYEDADLCLRLAEAGWATVYEPAARVTHVRYASSDGERAHELSARNRERFVARWRERLATLPPSLSPPHPATVLAARDAVTDGRVLVLADAADPATVERLLAALLELRPRARVTLLAAPDAEPWAQWAERGVEVATASDTTAWLDQRRFHADLVIGGSGFRGALHEFQPQALVLDEPPGLAELAGALTRAGLASAVGAG